MFQDAVKLVAGDLNARFPTLETEGRRNTNGVRMVQFLNDFPEAHLMGTGDATQVWEGRLDYALLLNSHGPAGSSRVIPELLSDHFALDIQLPLTKI